MKDTFTIPEGRRRRVYRPGFIDPGASLRRRARAVNPRGAADRLQYFATTGPRTEPVVHADAGDVVDDVHIDGRGREGHKAGGVGDGAEIDIEVLELGAPVAAQRRLDAGGRSHPAGGAWEKI